ncbi:hypothetical protein KM043_008550 [Ampulex compressa]|nr:hypothetical protein KM043_008550 [Ampulex compressa]
MSLELTKPTLEFALRKSMLFYASRIYDILGYVLPWPPETKFFTDLISRAIRHRRENNIVRNDFVDTLMQIEQHPEKLPGIDVTTQFLAAQAYLFYIAGFDTSANTMSNVLYELALNPDIQEKLRKEIFDLSGNSGKIQIEDIKQMSYLDQVIKETLRKYPISTDLVRRSTKSYTFQKIGLTIPEGLIVRIPVYAIHHDPNIYPEPDVFNPERFSKENQETRHQMSYLPFGNGPRICLGLRFANFQVKIGITTILQKYKIERCDKTIIPYVVNPRAFFLQPKDQTVVKFTKLNGIQSQKICCSRCFVRETSAYIPPESPHDKSQYIFEKCLFF